jgi:amino acid permease
MASTANTGEHVSGMIPELSRTGSKVSVLFSSQLHLHSPAPNSLVSLLQSLRILQRHCLVLSNRFSGVSHCTFPSRSSVHLQLLSSWNRFYIVGLLFVGLLVSSTDERLLGANPFINVAASPFVIAAKDAGLHGYDHFMNFIILISVISIGNSGIYGGSRTLTALAEQGYAPSFFTYIDKTGRPLFSTIAILVFGCLGYVTLSANGSVVFDWLLALSGLAALFTWGSICLAHIRFRAAWKYQGHTLEEIPFKAVFGVYGSWAGLILIFLVLMAQVRFFPSFLRLHVPEVSY